MELPKLIAEIQESGLTQVQIASRAGLAQSTVSQLLRGQRGKRVSARTHDALTLLWKQTRSRREAA